jgi:hypothetical protein
MGSVWVGTYWNTNDEADNGVVGVWATEELAREGAIANVRQYPGLADHEIRWFGERLRHRAPKGSADRNWYEVRPEHAVTEWEVQG